MSVAYDVAPRVRRVRPQAPAVVLPFPRPASVPGDDPVDGPSRLAAASAVARPRAIPVEVDPLVVPADVAHLPGTGSRERIDGDRRADRLRGPVDCPSSHPVLVRDPAWSDTRGGRIRLTARGRRVRALVCACALVVAGWITVSAIRSATTSPVIPPSAPAVVHVHDGDTLWSIAARVAPRQDPRRVVDTLRSANHLDSSTIHPGQQLRIPR